MAILYDIRVETKTAQTSQLSSNNYAYIETLWKVHTHDRHCQFEVDYCF